MRVGLLGAGRIGALHAGVLAGDPGVDALLYPGDVAGAVDTAAAIVSGGVSPKRETEVR